MFSLISNSTTTLKKTHQRVLSWDIRAREEVEQLDHPEDPEREADEYKESGRRDAHAHRVEQRGPGRQHAGVVCLDQ